MGSLFSRSAGNTRSLDGLRATMCIWMIVFHSLCWQNFFLKDSESEALMEAPLVKDFVLPGYMAVDVFLALTGYLLASSLFRKHSKAIASVSSPPPPATEAPQAAAAASQPSPPDTPSLRQRAAATKGQPASGSAAAVQKPPAPPTADVTISLRSWVYRRIMRVLPGVAAVALLWCKVVFPSGNIPVNLVNSDNTWRMINRHFQGSTHMPNGCEAVWANLLFVNQLLPFGGCMLYTWSLAIQVHVYLVLPLVWNFGGVKGLVRTCVAGLVVAAALRVFAQLQLRDVLPKTDELTYFGFFWYSFTLTRVAPICYGILAAYGVVKHNIQAWLKRHSVLVWAGWAAFGGAMLCARAQNYLKTMESPAQDATSQLVSVLVHPGGMLMSACITFMIVCVDHGIGPLGKALNVFLSMRIWAPIAELSFLAYLLHPMVMQKAYATVLAPIQATQTAFAMHAAFNVAVTLVLAAVLHICIDKPAQALVSRKTGAQGEESTLRRVVTWLICGIYMTVFALSVVVHAILLYNIALWEPDASSYNGQGPDAVIT